jgi:hypothetical protein
VDLGILMGKREAFTTLAGRCGAAQAEPLRRIRESQVYRDVAAKEFGDSSRHVFAVVR